MANSMHNLSVHEIFPAFLRNCIRRQIPNLANNKFFEALVNGNGGRKLFSVDFPVDNMPRARMAALLNGYDLPTDAEVPALSGALGCDEKDIHDAMKKSKARLMDREEWKKAGYPSIKKLMATV